MAKEIERRWVVGNYVTGDLQLPSKHIAQGYIDGERDVSTRIRIIDGKQAIKGIKRGQGVVREELEEPVSLEEGERLLATTDAVLHKDRIKLDGWDIDVLMDSFFGFHPALPPIIAERELAAEDEKVELPLWAIDAVEVTELLCSESLARFREMAIVLPAQTDFYSGYDDAPVVKELPSGARVIVLCGGSAAQREWLAGHIKPLMPESAVDVLKVACWLYPKDPTLFQAFLLKMHIIKNSLRQQRATFVLSGQSFAECWRGQFRVNPFELKSSNLLTVLLDEKQLSEMDDHEWVNSGDYREYSGLEGKALLEHWSGMHDVYYLDVASPEMQAWALKTVFKAFMSNR